jgi:hypothetical protein
VSLVGQLSLAVFRMQSCARLGLLLAVDAFLCF